MSQFPAMRVFLAHPKDHDDLEQAASDLTACLAAGGKSGIVTLGRDDFARQANARQGWGGWPASVAGMTNGAPRFNLIVVWPAMTMGRGTFQIVVSCSRAGRPVYYWDGKREFTRGTSFLPVVELHETRESPQSWGRIVCKVREPSGSVTPAIAPAILISGSWIELPEVDGAKLVATAAPRK